MIIKKLKLIIIFTLLCFSSIVIGLTDTNKPIEINALMPAPFADSTERLVEQFNQENKGKIHLTVTRGPRETESVSDMAISSMILGNSPIDILLIDVTWLPKYAATGWISPLDEWVNDEDIKSIISGARQGNSYKNREFRWPLVADIGLLYWRKDLMQEPPKTPDALIKISKKLQNEGLVKYGYVWQGRQYEGLSCVYLEVLKGFGGDWLDNSNQFRLDEKSSIKATNWLRELITSEVSPKAVTNFSEPEALQIFETGDSAFMRNWPYAWAELQKPTSSVKDKVGVTTMVADTNQTPTATLGSWGFSILKNSNNKDAAWKAISYLTSEQAQKELFLKYGYTPTKAKLFNDIEMLEMSPILPELEKALQISEPRPKTPIYAQLSDVLQRELSAVLTGQKDPQKAMISAQVSSENILKSAGELRS